MQTQRNKTPRSNRKPKTSGNINEQTKAALRCYVKGLDTSLGSVKRGYLGRQTPQIRPGGGNLANVRDVRAPPASPRTE